MLCRSDDEGTAKVEMTARIHVFGDAEFQCAGKTGGHDIACSLLFELIVT
jgi:hypothetical protein